MHSWTKLPFALSALLLSACATKTSLRSDSFIAVTPTQASTGQWNGSAVRWGGVVAGERLTDAGSCLEIAAFPVDSSSGKPYAGQPGDKGLLALMLNASFFLRGGGSINVPGRFLACREGVGFDHTAYKMFAVVTVEGTLSAPNIFQVKLSECRTHAPPSNYAGTVHASNDENCVVSLPVVNISSLKAWKEPAA
jgi:starvation-inducible outer membrane lipoprotein